MIRIVYGSHCELETQIMLSGDLDYIESDIVKIIMDEITEKALACFILNELKGEELKPTLY